MKCYCYETETDFVLCVEDAGMDYEEKILHAWYKKTDKRFLKIYPKNIEDGGVCEEDKALIKRNFARLGQSMFEGVFDWQNILLLLAQKFSENGIEWYLFGSTSEALLGVNIKPNDMDIIVHTRDFYKVKSLFSDYVVEPFGDNKGTWIVRYFGRLCLEGALIDIAADDKMNMENHQHQYEKVLWNGFEVFIEPLQDRYKVEISRNRIDRIKAIEKYMECT